MRKKMRVVAALIVRNGKVLVAQRSSAGSFPDKWEFPGGKVRADEKDEEALKRELLEELGTEAQVGEKLYNLEYDYPALTVELYLYRAFIAQGQTLQPLVHQALEWILPFEASRRNFLEADLPLVLRLEAFVSGAAG